MKPVKAISSCQHILIDTSFIIDVLSDPDRYKKDVVTQERIELAHKVFEELSLPRPKELKCMFYISGPCEIDCDRREVIYPQGVLRL